MNIKYIAISALGFVTSLVSIAAFAGDLDGCWRGERVVFKRQNGSIEQPKTDCFRSYRGDKLITSCSSGRETAVYSLSDVATGRYTFTQTARYVDGQSANFTVVLPRPATYRRSGNTLDVTLGKSSQPDPSGNPIVHIDLQFSRSPSSCESLAKFFDKSTTGSGSQVGTSKINRTPSSGTPDSGSNLAGAYGAPDLLGFRIGIPVGPSLDGQLEKLRNEGFVVTGMSRVTDDSGVSKGVFAYRGLQGQSSPASYLAVMYEPNSTVRAIVRGETFARPPFRADFAASIKAKFSAPDWVIDVLSRDVYGVVQSRELPAWGVAAGKAVKIDECFSGRNWMHVGKGFLHQPADGRNFIKSGWMSLVGKGLTEFKTGYCQYAVLVQSENNIVASNGKNVGELVNSYSVTILDAARIASDRRGDEQSANTKAEAERNSIRASSTKPKF